MIELLNSWQRRFAALVMVSLAVITMVITPVDANDAEITQGLHVFPESINLTGGRDFQRVVVQWIKPDGVTTDLTTKAKLAIANPALARLHSQGVMPVADGKTQLIVEANGQRAVVPVEVSGAGAKRPISFKLDVMPVFMSAGCNTGACHGAARGKDGFRLSLFGYDPDGDYFRLTREMAGRRINLALPDESLMVTKAIGSVQHTGGKLFGDESSHYQSMLEWLRAGAPKDGEDLKTPERVELLPKRILLEGENARQQMIVRAHYSDGSDRDVTHLAVFSSSNDNSAPISADGVVTSNKRGEAFVMARFETFTVGTHAIVIPKGAKAISEKLPAYNFIDEKINAKLKQMRMMPSELCTDSEFLRRAHLDIIGRLPTIEDYEAFIADPSPNKREALVDRLLARDEFTMLWVMKWAELLQIRSRENQGVSYKATLLYHDWLKDRISRNVPMNQIVRELLGSKGATLSNPPTNYFVLEPDTLKLAENTAQIFMGMRLQCAQCHNHPFDRWTMDDYYGFAAFFAQVGRKNGEDPRERIVFDRRGGGVNHPVTKKDVLPKFLGGESPDTKGKDRRVVLADWLASPQNPYFARNLSNIVWAHFMGRGIIDPVDDVRISNPPSNPQLLDELAARFTEYNYDFKRLVRDICTSRTYQLATRTNETNATDDRNFSHALVRRVRAEVLLDCISQATDTKDKFRGLPMGARAVEISDGRTSNYFLSTFGRATRETACSCEVVVEPNLAQALHMINGNTVNGKIRQGGVVRKMLAAKKTPAEVIHHLYLRTLTRPPTDKEMSALLAQVDAEKDKARALEDVFWSLLNAKEFVFNH